MHEELLRQLRLRSLSLSVMFRLHLTVRFLRIGAKVITCDWISINFDEIAEAPAVAESLSNDDWIHKIRNDEFGRFLNGSR